VLARRRIRYVRDVLQYSARKHASFPFKLPEDVADVSTGIVRRRRAHRWQVPEERDGREELVVEVARELAEAVRY
jgi:hypothetical protein